MENLALITPIRSLPTPLNTGIGSLHGALPFFGFIKRLGFNVAQVDPDGFSQVNNISPYLGTTFSTSPLQIDLTPLETEAWGNLLAQGTTAGIAAKNPRQHTNRVAYPYAYKQVYETALTQAYKTFVDKRQTLPDLDAAFAHFKQANAEWLQRDALFDVLNKSVYHSDDWEHWKGPNAELDKHLFRAGAGQAEQQRIQQLEQRYAQPLDRYAFVQFIASQQKQDVKNRLKKMGMQVMADRQVGWSISDRWAYQDVALKGWVLGCPPDYFSKDGQIWNFPIIDPAKLFDANGQLDRTAPGTQLLERLYRKIFSENTGVRIDHTLGLIDPWVYPKDAPTTKDGTRLFSSPTHDTLKQYSRVKPDDINKDKAPDSGEWVKQAAMTEDRVRTYGALVDQLILPLAKAAGIDKNKLIFEDLGAITAPTATVLKKRGLSAIRVTQFINPHDPQDMHRGKNVPAHHWLTPGTHDNPALYNWVTDMFIRPPDTMKHDEWAKRKSDHLLRLQYDMYGHLSPSQCKRRGLKTNWNDAQDLTRAMVTELFLSPARNVQLFFADWFGMRDTYNQPGLFDDNVNWQLRIPHDYQKAYFKAVSQGKAINLPRTLRNALKIKQPAGPCTDKAFSSLVKELDHLAAILDEPVR
ncbi:MAG: 4-alpha-glucanotransferase [Vampirovibrionales bacterium]